MGAFWAMSSYGPRSPRADHHRTALSPTVPEMLLSYCGRKHALPWVGESAGRQVCAWETVEAVNLRCLSSAVHLVLSPSLRPTEEAPSKPQGHPCLHHSNAGILSATRPSILNGSGSHTWVLTLVSTLSSPSLLVISKCILSY